jgi:hypothetical protein
MSHSATLVVAYAVACGGWWLVSRLVPLWRAPDRPTFAHPWREAGLALLAGGGVIALGQLWLRGIRLSTPGRWYPLAESINQIIIFSPIVLLPVVRRQGWSSAWIQPDRLWARLGLGLGLAWCVLLVYSLTETGAPGWDVTVREVYRPAHFHLAVQVLLEDLAIAILFVRFAAALSPLLAFVLVAALFAGGHVPTMLAKGASSRELLELIRDFGLVILMIGTVWRGADIAWFWPVHYALDMTQFIGKTN